MKISMNIKGLFVVTVSLLALSGCVSERPLSSYDDAGLCALKGQAMGYGNTELMPRITQEFNRRGKLTITQAQCDENIKTGANAASINQATTNAILFGSPTVTVNRGVM